VAAGPLIGLVAGEASGDTLGAALIGALRERLPGARFCGVAGPKMRAAGCEVWAEAEELAVMGLTEIVRHLPRLLRLRGRLQRRLLREQPAVFIGIDAPEFNLRLERALKVQGLRTVQYVSPQVWAWRQGRVRTMHESCDLVLCLLPFETDFYRAHGVPARFVGHPLADQIPLDVDRAGARRALGLDSESAVVALLPGSRVGEAARLAEDFIGAARWLAGRRPGIRFVAPMATARVRAAFEAARARVSGAPQISILDGQAQLALAAADAVLVASGTATLETLLCRRPMVVAYRLGALTAFVLRRLGLVKVAHFSQPNLLLGRGAVPEFFQEAVRAETLGAALLAQLEDSPERRRLLEEFADVHRRLRAGGAAAAAQAVLELLHGGWAAGEGPWPTGSP
jgi:lipid-A-disaccharide synthase